MPAPDSDVRNLVDALLASDKQLAGIGEWRTDMNGAHRYVRAVEYRGEIAAELCVKSYPRQPQLSFRLILYMMDIAIWRLDYTQDDKPHFNSHDKPLDLVLGPIQGPHYHAWGDNRRFATAHSLPKRLFNARILSEKLRSFDNAFRWFCAETRVFVANEDVPELPKRDTLL